MSRRASAKLTNRPKLLEFLRHPAGAIVAVARVQGEYLFAQLVCLSILAGQLSLQMAAADKAERANWPHQRQIGTSRPISAPIIRGRRPAGTCLLAGGCLRGRSSWPRSAWRPVGHHNGQSSTSARCVRTFRHEGAFGELQTGAAHNGARRSYRGRFVGRLAWTR